MIAIAMMTSLMVDVWMFDEMMRGYLIGLMCDEMITPQMSSESSKYSPINANTCNDGYDGYDGYD